MKVILKIKSLEREDDIKNYEEEVSGDREEIDIFLKRLISFLKENSSMTIFESSKEINDTTRVNEYTQISKEDGSKYSITIQYFNF